MDLRIKSNAGNLMEIFFKQITELGSLTIIMIITLMMFFFNKGLCIRLLIGVTAVTVISFIIKAIFFRERPKKQSKNTLVQRLDASSFPSIHSARITVMTFWLAVYSTSIISKIFLILVGIMVAYSRIYLKKHYLTDVIGGIVLAAIINLCIYYMAFMI